MLRHQEEAGCPAGWSFPAASLSCPCFPSQSSSLWQGEQEVETEARGEELCPWSACMNCFLPTSSAAGSCSLSQMRMVCQAQSCTWFEGFFVLFLLLTPTVDGCGTMLIPSQPAPLGWQRKEAGDGESECMKGFAESWGWGVQEFRAEDWKGMGKHLHRGGKTQGAADSWDERGSKPRGEGGEGCHWVRPISTSGEPLWGQ